MRKLILLLFTVSILASACKVDEPASIGAAVIDADTKPIANYTDTLIPLTFTKRMDSVLTDDDDLVLLGTFEDPIFGTVATSFVTELEFSSDPISKGTFDSIVLVMQYDGGYFGTLDNQTFEVFQYTDTLNIDDHYYSNKDISTKFDSINILGSITITPDPTNINGMRIKLDSVFGQEIFDAIISLNNADSISNDNLRDILPGLYVRSNNPSQAINEGAIVYFDLSSVESSLSLHSTDKLFLDSLMRPDNTYAYDTIVDVLEKCDLEAGSQSTRFSLFKHNYLGTSISFNDTSATKLYIQPLEGTEVVVKLGDYLKFKDSTPTVQDSVPAVINKAILSLKVDATSTAYEAPSRLVLLELNSAGKIGSAIDYISDALISAESTDNTGNTNGKYEIDISQYLQKLIDGEGEDHGLLITCDDIDESGNRVVLNGFNNTVPNRSRVIITFTTP